MGQPKADMCNFVINGGLIRGSKRGKPRTCLLDEMDNPKDIPTRMLEDNQTCISFVGS